MNLRTTVLALVLAVPLVAASTARAEAERKPTKELISFSALRAPSSDEARSQALAWLKAVGKSDAATLKAFDEIWSKERPVADRVAQTLALGDAEAAKLLAEARDPSKPAPTAVPAALKDGKMAPFYKANLALARHNLKRIEADLSV